MAETVQPEPKIAPWKRGEVAQLAQLIQSKPVVAVAEIDKLPSKQFQDIRASVRGHADIRVAKKRLLRLAFEEAKANRDNIQGLEDHLGGQVALIVSDMNPFKLFSKVEASKANAPAKGGDLAPEDIEIKKGDTPFPPGPIVGDLQKAGLPARIEGGKVVIAQDKLLVKQGEEISAELAGALARLEIHPMVVGLDVRAVWEDGTLFERSVLDVDADAILADTVNAHARAMALAVEIVHATAKTAPLLISKAARSARGLALEAGIVVPELVGELLGRAQAQAMALKAHVPDQGPATPEDDQAGEDEPTAEAEGEGPEAGDDDQADEASGEAAPDDEDQS